MSKLSGGFFSFKKQLIVNSSGQTLGKFKRCTVGLNKNLITQNDQAFSGLVTVKQN